MYNRNEKKSENWKNWIAIFTVGLLLILVYKLLDNFTQIGEWIGTLFSVLAPFLVGLLIAYYICHVEVWRIYIKKLRKRIL